MPRMPKDQKEELITKKAIELIDTYLGRGDWKVKENSNMGYSLQGLNNYIFSEETKKYWLHKVYDKHIREAHEKGELQIHDCSSLSSYCVGWDFWDILCSGFKGVPDKIESGPPRHFSAALGISVNFMYTLTGEAAGAMALSNFDTLLAPFVRYDKLTYSQIKQCLQEYIFNMNVSTRVGFQPVFSNLTMDLTVSPNFIDTPIVIGGETDWYLDDQNKIVKKDDGGLNVATYRDFQKEMDLINKAFCEVMMEGDAKGRVFTFPILTYNVTSDFDWNNPKLKPLFEMSAKYGSVYWSNFINSDMSPEMARSMCPMTGDTEVLVKSNHRGIRKEKIITIINTMHQKGTQYQVWSGKEWVNARPIVVDKTKVLKITLSNGEELKFGINHLQPTMNNGVLRSEELKEGMWLPFNKNWVNPSEIGSLDLGYAVGAYVGDGSHDKNALIYSLCKFEKDDETELRLVSFWNSLGFECKTTTSEKNVRFVRINGSPYDIMKKFVSGHNALEKRLTNKCLKMGSSFIEGFIEGYRDTDGSRQKRRIYSASKELLKDVGTLLSLIGEKYLIHNKDERPNRLGSNPVYRLDNPKRNSYGDYYKEDDQYHYYMIEKIEEVDFISNSLYCFEVDTDDSLFMLASGLMTHNCRLRISLDELHKKGGGLFGSGSLTGSVGVVTVNLPRIGHKFKDDERGYFKELDRLLHLSRRSLLRKREIVEGLTDKGLYPYSKYYLRNVKSKSGTYWNNHFNTIGILGMHESCLNLFGKGIQTKEGKEFAIKVLKYIREKLLVFQDEDGCLYNLEATPGEGTSYRFAKKDREEFGKEIIISGESRSFYTNSTHLPVDYDGDIFDVLEHQDDLQVLYSGGTTVHLYLGQRIDNPDVCKKLVKKIAENFRLPYFTLSPVFSICPTHGYVSGEHHNCPHNEGE